MPDSAAPNLGRQLLYMSGLTKVRADARPWMEGVLRSEWDRRTGLLLAAPNACMLALAGVVLLLTLGDLFGLIFIAGAAVVLIAGLSVPSLADRRTDRLAAKNSISLS